MSNLINKVLNLIKSKKQYHQITLIFILLILVVISITHLSDIQKNRALLKNAKSDYVYVANKYNLIEDRFKFNQLINESENVNSLLINISKNYNLANFQISQENAQKSIRFEVDDLRILTKLTNIFSQENFIKITKVSIVPSNANYKVEIYYT
jgi:nitrous oxide reductase